MSQMMPHLESYFRGFVPRRDELLLEMEIEAKAEDIPIVGPVVGELLFILTRATGAVNVLELGTATGYSAIHLARGCQPARAGSPPWSGRVHGGPGPGQLCQGRAGPPDRGPGGGGA